MISQAVYSKLSGTSAITALVGTRIYPYVLPQDCTLPAITFFTVSNVPIHAFGADAELYQPHIQVSSWGSTYAEAHDVSEAVKTALRDSTGTWGSTTIQGCFYEDERDIYDYSGSDLMQAYQVAQDYRVWHT